MTSSRPLVGNSGGYSDQAAAEFLRRLYGPTLPDGARIALWRRADKASIYLSRAEQAAEYDAETDLYVTASLVPAHIGARGARVRVKAQESVGIPGVWLDIDINGGPSGGG